MEPSELKTPQDIFDAFSKQTTELLEGFTANQNQEMVKEFMNAWHSLTQQALQNPQAWLEQMLQYQQTQMQLWTKFFLPFMQQGTMPTIQPTKGDRRFHSEEWDKNPVFDYIKQSYLLTSDMLMKIAEAANLDEDNQKKLRFYTKYYLDAVSPTNFAMTNPDVMQHAIETQGQSLIDGLKNLLTDMAKGRISMTDESAFELGKNLAVTEGAVVYQNRLMQIIQYKPTTETVSSYPLLIVPPSINKYYILDLQPKNSFVKYAVDQGNTVFLISWANPDESLRDVDWDNYLSEGILEAVEIVKNITNAEKLNTVSWCVGGTLLASALAVLHGQNKADSIASATYFTTMLDFSETGDLAVFIDELQVAHREANLKHTGIFSGKDFASVFSMIRANDLIWSYVVNNYLKGQSPTPFDILYWNSDSTNLPAKMYSTYIRNMYLDNKLIQPNALTMCGVPVNLNQIDTPSFFLSTIDDHIAPWKTTFSSAKLLGGNVEFVLGASGHVAGVINPPAKQKRSYWHAGEFGDTPEKWLETAESTPGSWWPHWDQWLKQQGGESIPALQQLGNDTYSVIENAPGSYVKRRIV